MFRWLKKLAVRAAKYAGIPLRDPALVAMLGSQPSASGMDMDEVLALNLSTVWQAVNIIASNVASMPPVPHELLGDDATREAAGHYTHDLLTIAPNEEMGSYTFVETLQAHALTWGNGYALLGKDRRKDPVEDMTIIPPNQCEPQRNNETGALEYRFTAHYPGEVSQVYPAWRILHIAGLGFDGMKGYGVVDMARESLGLAAAVERYGAAFFGRGSTPGGILQLPPGIRMSDKAKKTLRESFELIHRGPDNAHRIAVLEDGVTWVQTGLPPETAQFLSTRVFQVVEVARWFNIPPHLLRDLQFATYSNIEQQSLDFLVYTLRPWLIRWQQELRRKVFTRAERRRMVIKHDTSTLLLTDLVARYNAYQVGRQGGWLSLNKIMRKEGMNPLPSALGDSYLVPQNMSAVNPDGTDALSDKTDNMKGPEVSAMLAIVQGCASGLYNEATAKGMIAAAYPTLSVEQIAAIVDPIKEGKTNVSGNGGASDSAASAEGGSAGDDGGKA